MKLIKDKAFTLIELLAVILILGIIALIAIPTVNNIINESKKGAFKSTVQNIISAAEQQCEVERLRGTDVTNYYVFENGEQVVELGIKGENPTNGSITVDDECNVDLVLNKDNYIAVIENDKVEIIEDKYYTPGTKVTYDPGDNTYTTWYALKDNGNTVTLLLDKNIGIDYNYYTFWALPTDYEESGGKDTNYTSLGPITAVKKLKEITSSWKTEVKDNIRLITVEDILEVLGVNEWDKEKLYFDTKSNVAPEENEKGKYAWIYGNIGCNDAQCTQSYLMYWTGNKADVQNMVYVIKDGVLSTSLNYKSEPIPESSIGQIRPVITIPKTSIQ